MVRNSILLFSGGKESVYNLHKAHSDVHTLLYFYYGQGNWKKELLALDYYKGLYGIPHKEVITLPLHKPESIVTGEIKSTTVPMRNTIFVTTAANYAAGVGCNNVITGVIKEPGAGLKNDGFSPFLFYLEILTKAQAGITLKSPSAYKTTPQIIRALIRENVDLSHLWMCEKSGDSHCGNCYKCSIVSYELEHVHGTKECLTFKKIFFKK